MCAANGLSGKVDSIFSVQADGFDLVGGKAAVLLVEIAGQFILEDSPDAAVIGKCIPPDSL